jgi:hypothetical protein
MPVLFFYGLASSQTHISVACRFGRAIDPPAAASASRKTREIQERNALSSNQMPIMFSDSPEKSALAVWGELPLWPTSRLPMLFLSSAEEY